MMRRFAIFAGAMMVASAAFAAGVPAGSPGFPGTAIRHVVTPHASCAAVQGAVQRGNHAYLIYSSGNWLVGYGRDRVVKDQRFCLHGEAASPIWVPTRDNSECFAGFTCSEGGERGSRRGGR